jgi:hypothetical protein
MAGREDVAPFWAEVVRDPLRQKLSEVQRHLDDAAVADQLRLSPPLPSLDSHVPLFSYAERLLRRVRLVN